MHIYMYMEIDGGRYGEREGGREGGMEYTGGKKYMLHVHVQCIQTCIFLGNEA